MNETQSNQTELPLLASKFKRRKATARYNSFDKTTGVKMLAKTGGRRKTLPSDKETTLWG